MFNTQLNGQELAKSGTLVISSIVQNKEAGGDCGCYYYSKNHKKDNFILYWPLNNNGTGKAVIKINNKLTYLDYVNEKLDSDKKAQLFYFKNNKFNLSGKTISYKTCDTDEKYCESWGEKGDFTLSNLNNSITVKIEGTCGC